MKKTAKGTIDSSRVGAWSDLFSSLPKVGAFEILGWNNKAAICSR
jgi:hypothetical protein